MLLEGLRPLRESESPNSEACCLTCSRVTLLETLRVSLRDLLRTHAARTGVCMRHVAMAPWHFSFLLLLERVSPASSLPCEPTPAPVKQRQSGVESKKLALCRHETVARGQLNLAYVTSFSPQERSAVFISGWMF